MTPEFVVSPSLPALGWFTRAGKGGKRAVVVHGVAVETAEGFFVALLLAASDEDHNLGRSPHHADA